MKKKEISSFSATYIVIGLLGILFLLYHNGITIYNVKTQAELFNENNEENKRLRYKVEELKKVKEIRSTPEFKDRFDKENFNVYKPGEIVLVLPPKEEPEDEFKGLTPQEIEKELEKKAPIIDQWKKIFFKAG